MDKHTTFYEVISKQLTKKTLIKPLTFNYNRQKIKRTGERFKYNHEEVRERF